MLTKLSFRRCVTVIVAHSDGECFVPATFILLIVSEHQRMKAGGHGFIRPSRSLKVKNPIKAIQYPEIKPPKDLSNETKIIFVGTGASGTTPHLFCRSNHVSRTRVLAERGSRKYQYGCGACHGPRYFASYNRRANTGILVCKKGEEDEMK